MEVLGLVPLARVTRTYEVLDQAAHVGGVEATAEPVQGTLHPLVAVLVYGSQHLLEQWGRRRDVEAGVEGDHAVAQTPRRPREPARIASRVATRAGSVD